MSDNRTLIDFRALANFPDFCFLLDEKSEIQSVNETYIRQVRLRREELTGKKFEHIVHPASILKFSHALYSCVQHDDTQTVEIKLAGEGDDFLDVRLIISLSHADSNGSKTFLLIGKDITDEKKKEVDLLRFYFVAQNTVNPLQITDLNGKMIYVNPAFEKASGYHAAELLGQNPRVFGSGKHPQRFWDDMWITISSGKVWVGEVENQRKDGEPFYTQLLISPIVDHDEKVIGYFGIHRDLTEKRNLEKQLIHTQKMESIGTLAAGVAHEVGNPLASISALVQIIQRQTADEFIKEKLELVKKQITRISKIIRDLVDFSRPSNFEMRLTDINENVIESIEIVRVGKKAKDIDFPTELDETLTPLRLVSDQIQQVFVNILINAVDALADKKAKNPASPKGRIKTTTTFRDNHFVVIFEDNGTGVKQEHVTKIFEPFFTTKTEGKGTGLGLWVSYGIIKSFQGDITVESKPNEWTRFTIHLPFNPSF